MIVKQTAYTEARRIHGITTETKDDIRVIWSQLSAYALAQRRGTKRVMEAKNGHHLVLEYIDYEPTGIVDATIAEWYTHQTDKVAAATLIRSAGATVPATTAASAATASSPDTSSSKLASPAVASKKA